MLEFSQRALAGGLDPEVVGEQVLEAVKQNQFWLFTDEDWDSPIAERASRIGTRESPRFKGATQS